MRERERKEKKNGRKTHGKKQGGIGKEAKLRMNGLQTLERKHFKN